MRDDLPEICGAVGERRRRVRSGRLTGGRLRRRIARTELDVVGRRVRRRPGQRGRRADTGRPVGRIWTGRRAGRRRRSGGWVGAERPDRSRRRAAAIRRDDLPVVRRAGVQRRRGVIPIGRTRHDGRRWIGRPESNLVRRRAGGLPTEVWIDRHPDRAVWRVRRARHGWAGRWRCRAERPRRSCRIAAAVVRDDLPEVRGVVGERRRIGCRRLRGRDLWRRIGRAEPDVVTGRARGAPRQRRCRGDIRRAVRRVRTRGRAGRESRGGRRERPHRSGGRSVAVARDDLPEVRRAARQACRRVLRGRLIGRHLRRRIGRAEPHVVARRAGRAPGQRGGVRRDAGGAVGRRRTAWCAWRATGSRSGKRPDRRARDHRRVHVGGLLTSAAGTFAASAMLLCVVPRYTS